MLRIAEEIILLLLDEHRGEVAPQIPEQSFRSVLAGAVLMELALEDRIDTDPVRPVLLDSTPLGDELLDLALRDIAKEPRDHDTKHWLVHVSKQADTIRDLALAQLIRRGILDHVSSGIYFLSHAVQRSRRYPNPDGDIKDDVRLRVTRILLEDDLPNPRDIPIIALANACGHFEAILSSSERTKARERVELLCSMDLIGRSVSTVIREYEASLKPTASSRPVAEIPQVRGLPLLGSAYQMATDAAGFLAAQYRILGPVFRVRAANRRYVVLAGPEANLFMSKTGRACLRSHETWAHFVRELRVMRSVISMDGADHLRLRRVEAAGYSRKRIEARLNEAAQIARREIRNWPQNRPISCQHAIQRIVTEQLCVVIANTSAREYLDDMIYYFGALLKATMTHHHPKLMLRRPRFRRARKRMDALCEEILSEHDPKQRRRKGRKESDLIDDLLELHRTDPLFMPEIDLVLSVMGPLLAGIDTAASICTFMLYETLKHPELLVRMTSEADALLDWSGGATVAGLRQLDVTHRVAMETLRIYPIAPAMPRTAANSFEFGGYAIPAGTEILFGSTVSHFDLGFFPDPERFDIDRYRPERAEHRHPGAYAPFGSGVHRCLGSGFAETQIALTIATILHEVEPVMEPPSYRLRISPAPLPHPDKSFRIRAVRRR